MRVFLFGVDGLTYRILEPYMERGLLPNFQRLGQEGAKGILKSIIPPLTPPAWVSIFTGLPSAKHGVYDFWEFEKTEEGPRAHVVTHRKGGKAVWNILSEWGKRVVVANVPMTYPPEPVNGYMISGYMAPDMKSNVTYPSSFKDELLEQAPEYQIDISPAVQHGQVGNLFAETLKMTRERVAMLKLLLGKPWDFFFIAFTGADRIQHMHWDEIMAFHPQAVQYYQMVDEALGMALDALGPDDMLMVVSDHGFQGTHYEFYIQEYLFRQGLLKMKSGSTRKGTEVLNVARVVAREVASFLRVKEAIFWLRRQLYNKGVLHRDDQQTELPDLDWEKTQAWTPFSSGWLSGYANIFFDETITEEQIAQLMADLKELRNPETGEPMTIGLHREGAFGTGEYAPGERHIVLLSNEDVSLPTKLGRNNLWEKTKGARGIHQSDGVVYLYGAGVKRGTKMAPTHIYDVTPTILAYMGMPLHADLAGKVMEEAFERPLAAPAPSSSSVVGQKLKKLAARKH